jgi:hypothetical protein
MVLWTRAYGRGPVPCRVPGSRTRDCRGDDDRTARLADEADQVFLRVGPAWVDRDAVNLLTQLGVRNFREVMTAPIGEPLDKPGLEPWRRRSRVVLQDLMGQEKVLYLKRFLFPPVKAQIERIKMGAWRHGTAWIEWNNIRRLEVIGVGTMRPIAFAEKVAAGWEVGSLLCTEQVQGESLEKWLPREWQAAAETFGPAWRQRAVRELAGVVARLHGGNLCHRDLYTCHIFMEVDAEARVCFRLIDLQRMFRVRLRKRRWRVKDLAALGASAPVGLISRTDRMRFLRAYLGLDRSGQDTPTSRKGLIGVAARQPGGGRGTRSETFLRDVKRWWRDVEGKGEQMMRHHEARMERLGRRGDSTPANSAGVAPR